MADTPPQQCAPEPIAIIGTGCRFPGGSTTPSKLWSLLRAPHDVARDVPPSRFAVANFHHPSSQHHGTGNVRQAYFLDEDVSQWDAGFFDVKASEARAMDPQHRLLLETVVEALDSAGQPLEALRGSDTAVYCGVMCGDYEAMLLRDLDALPRYHATGIGRSLMSNRISHALDWRGASVTLDTACSSSLVAVHLAVAELRSGRSAVAVATGSNLILGPENYVAESTLRMLSPQGRGRMWDAGADGYARGEGVAAVVMKTLRRALADGDPIECVIRNTGVGQDGRTLQGLTVPSAASQAALIRQTYGELGWDCSEMRPQYFEAHGTGTQAGDPVEARAIRDAFFPGEEEEDDAEQEEEEGGADDRDKMYVGSIKTVVGHTEGSAGIAALIKASLCLRHGQVAPNMLFSTLNPRVAPYTRHLQVPTELVPWPELASPQDVPRASVNSFGFGGTNAHAILEAYLPPQQQAVDGSADDRDTDDENAEIAPSLPFVLSAMSLHSLQNIVLSYRDYILSSSSSCPDSSSSSSIPTLSSSRRPLRLPELASTLASRRSVHRFRVAYTGSTPSELAAAMQARPPTRENKNVVEDTGSSSSQTPAEPQLLGIFTGQGAQWAGMGRALVTQSAWCRARIAALDAHLAASRLHADDDNSGNNNNTDENQPAWTLLGQLLGDPSSQAEPLLSLDNAALAQPLCTAVQILLVDLLAAAHVHFAAVVGHSSGEMGAAYAAGALSAGDAITIAYHRGRVCSMHAPRGAMLAVTVEGGWAEAERTAAEFELQVAAYNSATSVTLSGSEDKVREAKRRLDEDGVFARVLKVDKAYHSRLMEGCAEAYLGAMVRSGITCAAPGSSSKTLAPASSPSSSSSSSSSSSPLRRTKTRWFSSVFPGDSDGASLLSARAEPASYWVDNMVRPVMFAQALSAAVQALGGGHFDAVVEVGPHPALRKPALDTLLLQQQQQQQQQPNDNSVVPYYCGMLSRGEDDCASLAAALGALWCRLPCGAVDLAGYQRVLVGRDALSSSSSSSMALCKDLPAYPWDHRRSYWHESRRSRVARVHPGGRRIPLLGRLCADVLTTGTMSWRNFLGPHSVPWLEGHCVQGQAVFPAAGYVAMAIEACGAALLAAGKGDGNNSLVSVDVQDVEIRQAMTLGGGQDASSDRSPGGKEVLFTLSNVTWTATTLTASFTISADVGRADDVLGVVAGGTVAASFTAATLTLPASNHHDGLRRPHVVITPSTDHTGHPLAAVDAGEFYEYLTTLGYEYSGPFRQLSSLERRLNGARGSLPSPGAIHQLAQQDGAQDEDRDEQPCMVHPALLDQALQLAILAFSGPHDGRLRALQVPVSIRRVLLDATLLSVARNDLRPLAVSAELDDNTATSSSSSEATISGDVDISLPQPPSTPGAGGGVLLSVQGIRCVPLAPPTPADDVALFSQTTWDVLQPDAARVTHDLHPTPAERALALVAERVCYFYLRRLDQDIPRSHPARRSGPHVGMFAYAAYVIERVARGEHKYIPRGEWDGDTQEDVLRISDEFKETVDIRMAHAAGMNFRDVIHGKTTILEHMRKDGLLDRYYEQALAFPAYNEYLGRWVRQLSHRFPGMDILEVGAGTGSATKGILPKLGDAYHSYTFTDISSGFFPTAHTVPLFQRHLPKMAFKVLDVSRPPADQPGFKPASASEPAQKYDLIIASFVLHAVPRLAETMRHIRSLLRPGGYLAMLEVTDNEPIREGAVFGCLPGWWLGRDDTDLPRVYSPCIGVAQWHQLLQNTGFGGVDSVTPARDPLAHPVSLIVSQAVDERVAVLREPRRVRAPAHVLGRQRVLIVGGPEALAAQVADSLVREVGVDTKAVDVVSSFDHVPLHSPSWTMLVCLSDVADDDGFFAPASLTAARWSALQRLLLSEACECVLWASTGRHDGRNPHAAVALGFGRTLLLERPELACQFVDLDRVTAESAKLLSEMAARLACARQWGLTEGLRQTDSGSSGGSGSSSSVLWTVETELVVQEGVAFVPRLKRDQDQNDRYNAAWRAVHKEVDPATTPVALSQSSSSVGFVELKRGPAAVATTGTENRDGEGVVVVVTDKSLSTGLQLAAHQLPLRLVLGHVQQQQQQQQQQQNENASAPTRVATLSALHASHVSVPSSLVVEVPPTGSCLEEHVLVGRLADNLVAAALVHGMRSGQTLALYLGAEPEANAPRARAVARLAAKLGLRLIVFVVGVDDSESEPEWSSLSKLACESVHLVRIAPGMTARALRRVLPTTPVDRYVGLDEDRQLLSAPITDILKASFGMSLGNEARAGESLVTLAAAHMSVDKDCSGTIIDKPVVVDDAALDHLSSLLRAAVSATLDDNDNGSEVSSDFELVPIQDVLSSPSPTSIDSKTSRPSAVLDWRSLPNPLRVQLTTTMLSSTVFSPSKTYWLQGLSGSLGLSLCQFMAQRGARHIVLSSRHPRIPPDWIRMMRTSFHAAVTVLPCDVTSPSSIDSCLTAMHTANLPPLGGVTQGAMVLDDGVIANMSFAALCAALAPKVAGSRHLHAALARAGAQPDWLVFFSSGALVTGRMGQANYTAANAFMVGLARQRRRQGLPASVLHLGPVLGAGYVERIDRQAVRDGLVKTGYVFMSETDFHAAFAEAVRASSPVGPDEAMEVTTCVRTWREGDKGRPVWWANPRLSHLQEREPASTSSSSSSGDDGPNAGHNKQQQRSVADRLKACTSVSQAEEVMRDALLEEMTGSLQLQLSTDEQDAAAVANRRLADVGVDSLVAVEIRAWFAKAVGVNIPVLKIMGEANTLGDLVSSAMAELAPGMTPLLDHQENGADKANELNADNKASVPSSPGSAYSASTADQSMASSGSLSRTVASTDTGSLAAVTPLELESAGPAATPAAAEPGAGAEYRSSSLSSSSSSVPVVTKRLPLTSNQSMFWFVHAFLDDPTALNHTALYRVQAGAGGGNRNNNNRPLDVASLRRAVLALGACHEALRTRFVPGSEGQGPSQEILASSALALETQDIASEDEAWAEMEKMKGYAFRLDKGEVARFRLLRSGSESSDSQPAVDFLLIGCNHVNFDGVSLGVLLRHLAAAYQGLPLPSTVVQYCDWDAQQRQQQQKQQQSSQEDMAHLVARFTPPPAVLPLLPMARPGVRSRGPFRTYAHHRVDVVLDGATCAAIKTACRRPQWRCSPFHFYLTAWRLLLSRLLASEDVDMDGGLCIGTAVANRDAASRDAVGPIMNLVPLLFKNLNLPRTSSSDEDQPAMTLTDLVRDTKHTAQAALDTAHVSFDTLLSALRVPRSLRHAPLFQTFLNYRLGAQKRTPLPDGAEMELVHFEAGRTAYDASVDVMDESGADGTCRVAVMAQTALYDAHATAVLAEGFVAVVKALAAQDPDAMVTSVRHLHVGGEMTARALEMGQGPVCESRWDGDVSPAVRVLSFAQQTPQKTALIQVGHGSPAGATEPLTLSYEAVAARVVGIAEALLARTENPSISKGEMPPPGSTIVGVFMEPSADWVCSMLAIMLVGAVYVPLDPGLPLSRLADMARDCRPDVLLVQKSTAERAKDNLVSSSAGDIAPLLLIVDDDDDDNEVRISRPNHALDHYKTLALAHCPSPDAAAAIMYTSGSTGAPKGIVLTYANLANETEHMAASYGITAADTILQQSALGFDMSLTQMLSAACHGGALVVLPLSARGDAVAIVRAMDAHGVTVTGATPSEYLAWLVHGEPDRYLRGGAWRVAISGGETPRPAMLERLRRLDVPGLRLFNAYGPTEVTCSATRMELDYRRRHHGDVTAAGKPAPNCAVYVVDTHTLEPVPVGCAGEIVVGGAGVSKGYLHGTQDSKAQAAAAAFLDDWAYASPAHRRRGWTRAYRTGDRGRWLADGTLLVEGRISHDDTQVKLPGGVRLDLREIEAAILKRGGDFVADAVVTFRRRHNYNKDSDDDNVEDEEEEDLDSDGGNLVAFVVLQPAAPAYTGTPEFLEHFRTQQLPPAMPLRHMLPVAVVRLDALPRTRSGKTDRAALAKLSLVDGRRTDKPSPSSSSPSAQQQQQQGNLSTAEQQLWRTWCSVLGRDATATTSPRPDGNLNIPVAPTTDFFHVGGTSLLLVRLRSAIKAEYGVDLALVQLFECSSLRSMCRRIHGQTKENDDDDDKDNDKDALIDWDAETAIPASWPTTVPCPPKTPTRRIVLTGASGFLGVKLLAALVARPDVEHVYCIAVRSPGKLEKALSAWPSTHHHQHRPKISIFAGDLSLPSLGLSPHDTSSIFAAADAVLHGGCSISHMQRYRSLAPANVAATRALVRLALPRGLPVHFISSASVAGLSGLATWPDGASARDYPPPTIGGDGYTACKWASEVFLERANERTGLPVGIYRPTSILRAEDGDGDSGEDGGPGGSRDLWQELFYYSGLIRAVPESGAVTGCVNFVGAGAVVDAIVEGVVLGQQQQQQQDGCGRLRHVDLAGARQVALGQLREAVSGGCGGGAVEALPLAVWAQRAEEKGMPVALARFFAGVEGMGGFFFPRFVKGASSGVREG